MTATHKRLILTSVDHDRIAVLCGLSADNVDLVKLLNAAKPFSPTTEAERQAANDHHCAGSNDEIEVDEDAGASHGDDGYWVQAWVWVPETKKETKQ